MIRSTTPAAERMRQYRRRRRLKRLVVFAIAVEK